MEINDILEYCQKKLEGIVLIESWGEKGIYYNPNGKLKRGVYILTIKEKDGKNDKASNLNREEIFRLNIGIRKSTFKEIFGEIPKRPKAGQVVDMNYDFTAIDYILPHPVYGWMGWISINNPSRDTFEKIENLIEESYEFAKEKFNKGK